MSYLREVREDIQGLKDTVEAVLSSKAASNNVNTLKVEGAGKLAYGMAIGIPLGATIIMGIWMMNSQQDMRESVRQAETYRAAVYMVAPRLSEAIDQELDKRNNRYEPHPDSDPAAEERAEAGGSKGPGEAAGP